MLCWGEEEELSVVEEVVGERKEGRKGAAVEEHVGVCVIGMRRGLT